MADGGALKVFTPEERRKRILTRQSTLLTERQSTRDSDYREIIDYLIPRLGRFNNNTRVQPGKAARMRAILDSSGTRAHRVLAAGLMAGMSSPARRWARITLHDKALAEYGPVKQWLSDVTDLMFEVFAASNTYRALHSIYEEVGAFGTGLNVFLPDFNDVVRQYPMTTGEYTIACDNRGVVNCFYRELQMTVEQMVEEFTPGKCSRTVQTLYDRGEYDAYVPVVHAVEPRRNRDLRKRDARNKRFASVYLEYATDNPDFFLRDSGFDDFPAIAPRWTVSGVDVYGWSPGMEVLGDLKQLQHEQLRKSQVIDYQTEPPIQVPANTKGHQIDRLPGGVSFFDSTAPQAGTRTLFEVKLDPSMLLPDIQDIRHRIDQGFYADLFLMLANDDRSGTTAREVAERHEEKLLMLGPVLERLHDELLSRLVDLTFAEMVRVGIVPPPPQEIQGQELNIEFVSTLAQAQRMVGAGTMDRFLATVGSIAQMKPEVLDKLDGDQAIDKYADMLGVDPSVVVADEKVVVIREQRAKQQQAAALAAMAQPVAATAKDLAAADTSGKNALTDVMQAMQGNR